MCKHTLRLRNYSHEWELLSSDANYQISELLFVILFIVIPTVSKSPPILIPVPPPADTKPTSENITEWLDEFAIMPVMCHSHNGYWRPRPLITALMAGCAGIEADVWLTDDGQDLLVGHDRAALAPQKTLRTMYLDPLLDILDLRNPDDVIEGHDGQHRPLGVFKGQTQTPLILMIHVKENVAAIWAIVLEQLELFRQKGYLRWYENGTIWPGPLVVVGSGELHLDTTVASSKETPYYDYHDALLCTTR